MKLQSYNSQKGLFTFRFQENECDYLSELLGQYPVQTGAQPISSDVSADPMADEQALLIEAMAEHRQSQRAEIQKFLADPARFAEDKRGRKMVLDMPGIDWLLQMLNDIRVGSWSLLGRPEPDSPLKIETTEQLRLASAMQLCGIWQSVLLHALERQRTA